jgi:hypothetical protein
MGEPSINNYRERALAEYGEQCQACDDTRQVVVHHIDEDRANNSLDNLIPLCRSCHTTVHVSDRTLNDLLDGEWPDASFEQMREEIAIEELHQLRDRVNELSQSVRRIEHHDGGLRELDNRVTVLEHYHEVLRAHFEDFSTLFTRLSKK